MPKKFPEEFKRDVVRVARRGDLSQAEVAADFDISVESVRRWVRQADVDDGVVDGQTSSEQNELVQLRRKARRLEQENEILRRAAAYFAAGSAPKMSYPLVRDLAAEGIPVRLTCGVLGHSTQAYYAWLRQPVSQRDLDDAYFTNLLIDAYDDDPEFGYRLLADELDKLGHAGRGAAGLAALQPAEALVSDRPQGPPGQDARAGGPRRPGAAGLHRGRAEPGLGHRHHRAPDRRGQALLLPDQGPVQQQDRRLRPRRADDRAARRDRAADSRRPAPAQERRHRPLGPRAASSEQDPSGRS